MINRKKVICISIVFLIILMIGLKNMDKEYFNIVKYDQIHEKINSGKKFILVIGRKECPYCKDLIQKIKKDINTTKKYVYYFEMGKGDMKLKDKLIDEFGEFNYVPHVIYFSQEKIVKIKESKEKEEIYDNDFWNF